MSYANSGLSLEAKFCRFEEEVDLKNGAEISGYASIFGASDQGKDVVQKGAYSASLKAIETAGRRVKMLWQHDPSKPIGVWDIVRACLCAHPRKSRPKSRAGPGSPGSGVAPGTGAKS